MGANEVGTLRALKGRTPGNAVAICRPLSGTDGDSQPISSRAQRSLRSRASAVATPSTMRLCPKMKA